MRLERLEAKGTAKKTERENIEIKWIGPSGRATGVSQVGDFEFGCH